MNQNRRKGESDSSYEHRMSRQREDARIIRAIFGEELPNLLDPPPVFARAFQRMADRVKR